MKIVTVVAARPNFMKIAPFIRAIENYNSENRLPEVEHILVHTGQHYDIRMSEAFFRELSWFSVLGTRSRQAKPMIGG